MNINSFGFSTPRALALGTVAVTIGLGVASGVFSTFYTTIQSGQTCTYGYGYENGFGYGYGYGYANGYDCVAAPVVVVPTPPSSGGGGGGGGSSSSFGTPVSLTPTAITALAKDAIILAKDISSSQFKSAIETLIRAGVMNNATKVNPENSITRGEFLKLLAISNGYKSPVKVTKRFKDMPVKHTLLNYVNYGVSLGWVNTKNTNFRPNDIITQGEIDKLIAAIKKTANADTVAKKSKGVTRGKAANDIVAAFFSK